MNFEDPKTLALFGVAGLSGLILVVAVLRDLRMARWLVASMMLFSSLAPQSEQTGWFSQVWVKPLQERRAVLYAACAVALLLSALVHKSRTSFKVFPGVLACMMGIGLWAGMLDLRVLPDEGALRVILTLASVLGAVMVIPSITETWEDIMAFVRALGWVGVIWLGCVMVQLAIAPGQMTMGYEKRFVGLLGNPQGTAVFLAPQLTLVAWLAFNEQERRLRWVWILTLGGLLVLLGWTGSRTGALMSMTGLMAVLYARLGRAVLALPLVLGALYGMILLASKLGIEMPFERLVSNADTRTGSWAVLLEDALRAPLLGEGGQTRAVEHSFLLGWVVYGPVMALLIAVMFFATVVLSIRLWQSRVYVTPSVRRLIDLILGYFMMYWIGSNFEWYVVARIDANIPLMMSFACISGSILRQTAAARHELAHADEAPDYGELSEGEAHSA